MRKYEISGMRRIREYKILLNILSQYSARQFNYKNDGKEGTLSFTISKANALEMDKRLKESGLVFKILG